jgi:hypothetical protein
MKTNVLLVTGLALVLSACGGSESGPPDGSGGDGSNNGMDGTTGNDTGTGSDTGMGDDTGMGGDGGGMDGTTGMDGSSNFDPKSLSCLVLWLDASKGVTQMNTFVSAWADQSGQNNNAAQATGARQPSVAMNVINNLPALHFNSGQTNGNMLLIADSMSMQFGTGDFALWVVARFNNMTNGGFNTGLGLLYGKVPQGSFNFTGAFLLGNTFQNNQVAAGLNGGTSSNNILSVAAMYNDNTARNYGLRRTGASIELRVNGQQAASMNQNGNVDVSAANNPARIGANGDANFERLNGDIAEVIACKGATSMQDVANVDGYLKTKYALP